MKRDEILKTAESLVSGDRARQHGDARSNYKTVGVLWNAYYEAQGIKAPTFTSEDVMMLLALMKIGRAMHGDNPDNYVDACGYLALVGELATSAP